MFSLLFPRKCTLCRKLLQREETDFCHNCRKNTQEIQNTKRRIPFIAKWTALWYYKDTVRKSIHRFKFGNARSYGDVYGRQLARKLMDAEMIDDIDYLSWIPLSWQRRFSRGYDQGQLIAASLSQELGIPLRRTLRKVKHTKPQSRLRGASSRKANILGAYRVVDASVTGKRILLVDDVLTTGSTASECAHTLLLSGVKEIYFAAVAVASHDS